MSRSRNARRGHRGKGELWTRRASEAKVTGTYNARWVKVVSSRRLRRMTRVVTHEIPREIEADRRAIL